MSYSFLFYLFLATTTLANITGIVSHFSLAIIFKMLYTCFYLLAFRWPIKHKIVVTRQRVLGIITLSWLLSALPMIGGLINDSLLPSLPDCPEENFCRRFYYYNRVVRQYSWLRALPSVIFVALIFAAMILVYGYVLLIVHRVSLRNPGFRKKGTAIVTTTCLIVSFFLSYMFYFIQNTYAVVMQSYDTDLLQSVQTYFSTVCPACRLILDFLLTGMLGAILDPIIYCVRMKEVKSALKRFCKTRLIFRRLSFNSGGTGYTRAAQNSVTVDENL